MLKYRLAYRDGRNQEFTASKFVIEDKFIVFYTNGSPTLLAPVELVQYVSEASAPEPE